MSAVHPKTSKKTQSSNPLQPHRNPCASGERAEKTNRGPAVASRNHAALLHSARELFAERGYRVPLSAVAQRAGVGQGVLYRHFPSRIDLALAVVDESLTALEDSVLSAGGTADFNVAWHNLVNLAISNVAFVEILVECAEDPRVNEFHGRLTELLEPLLQQSQREGSRAQETTSESLFFALRAIYGLVVTRNVQQVPIELEVQTLLKALGLAITQ